MPPASPPARMDPIRPKASLPSTFDALNASSPRLRGTPLWLPFIAIAALLLLIAALFTALVMEDRQLQHEALQRDLDSAAQRMAARVAGIAETLTASAVEIGGGAIGERRFAGFARELLESKTEIEAVAYVDAAGAPLWAPITRAGALLQTDSALRPLAQQAIATHAPAYSLLDGTMPRLAIGVGVRNDRGALGTVLAQADVEALLSNGVGEEMSARYRVTLLAGATALAATSDQPAARFASRALTVIPTLPPGFRLEATPLRAPARGLGNLLAGAVIVLGIAVLVALAALGRYTIRLVRADRALLAETSLRRAMEDSQATGLRVLDRDGVIRYVNRAFCHMTGFPERELLGRAPPFPYWPPAQRADHEDKLRRLLAGDVPAAGVEVVVQRRDGSVFDARMYVSPLIGDDGSHIGWMTSMADVTEPKRIRNELAAAHDRFLKVLESLEAAVSVVAADGGRELLFANREYQHQFGQGAAGHLRLAALLRTGDDEALAGEAHDDQGARWYDVRMRAIRWVDDRAAWLQIATDITLRKTTEEIVRQQQEKVQFTSRLMTMGEMASSLAHELNQPLTAITNYSQGILSRLQAGPVGRDELLPALEKTSSQAQRAGRIIRRIREFVKRSEPRRRPTPAARIVDDAIGFAEIDARKKGIAIVASVAELPPLDVDPILIEQVLLNLLKNAIDAMDHATVRRIDVEVRRTGDSLAEIAVIDRGSGIPDEHRANLFQPFFSTKSEGMGMGLNICRSIIEFHQGRLTLEPNPEPAGGTILRFTLPLANARSGPTSDENAGSNEAHEPIPPASPR